MLKNDLMVKNPLRGLVNDSNALLTSGEFGAILARAGVMSFRVAWMGGVCLEAGLACAIWALIRQRERTH